LLKGSPIKIFSGLPTGIGRKDIHNMLEDIRIFRNRINHNEPICFNGNTLDFITCESIHNSIYQLFKWIDPELIDWISDIDNVIAKIENGKTLV